MKTVERSHLPAQLWEKIKLPNNYRQGLEVIEKHLEYWPEFLKQKCAQRLKRLFQYLSKVRRLRVSDKAGQLEVFKQKTERRESRREKKAETTARLDQSIEKELILRLKSGLYQDIYNVSQDHFEKVLKDDLQAHSEEEDEVEFEEFVADEDDDLYDEYLGSGDEEGPGIEYENEFVESEDDLELLEQPAPKRTKKEAVVLIEYEDDSDKRQVIYN